MRTLLRVVPGLEITVRAMRWSAGWEFDCPTAVISPVFREYEDGRSTEGAIEDLCIDAILDGEIKSNDIKFWEEFRGWSMDYLERKFYRKHVQRETQRIRFILDEDGELSWEVLAAGAKGRAL